METFILSILFKSHGDFGGLMLSWLLTKLVSLYPDIWSNTKPAIGFKILYQILIN